MSVEYISPADESARQEALNPLNSYCVTAPAGSGKTALLVKRFLTLLSRCEEPEQVVAITFTRKAAAEMRSRVLAALTQSESSAAPANDHERQLRSLAREVLVRDKQQGWQLLSMPNRLTIRTIDSFCAELSRQMPVLSGVGGPLAVTDDGAGLYEHAVQQFMDRQLSKADGLGDDLRRLMLHLDNRWNLAVGLLSDLLSRREQWQPVFGHSGFKDDEQHHLQSVAAILIDDHLQEVRQALGSLQQSIAELMAVREANLSSGVPFDPNSDELAGWRQLVDVLLTQSGAWRKGVNKRDGFPAGKGIAGEKRDAMNEILKQFRATGDDDLRAMLEHIRVLPDPSGDAYHWQVLAAVTRLLPALGAELLLVFQRHGQVDHAQIALAAIEALGDDDDPTDIALRLDYRIDHLLVDEFQDTSSLQFELVRRLTRGWHEHNAVNPEAPRTLLVVGDAMQSIYGFREANVGLFMRARDEGVGDLKLTPLELTVNFRSVRGLVEWNNRHFQSIFPHRDDEQIGAVRFRRADSMRTGSSAADIHLYTGDGAAETELETLCDRLEAGLADPRVQSMAILGRSRTHLRPILAALRDRDLPFAGQDLDALGERPVIRDLMTLCAVLADPFDRLPWLSLLRCPVAAMDHGDLLQVALHLPIPALLDTADEQGLGLSTIGQERLQHLRRVLHWAGQYRHRLALRVWVEECWTRIGGPSTLHDAGDAADAERFFQLLEAMEQNRELLTQENLEQRVAQLYGAPAQADSKLQLMTLHKAKGLEFDEVFIPSLGRGAASQDRELLLWDELSLPGHGTRFLLDVRAGSDQPDAPQLYDFLRDRAQRKRRLESDRLFYVGCTRAANYLWLSASVTWDEDKDAARPPQSGSLLARLWPHLDETSDVLHCIARDGTGSAPVTLPYRRLQSLPPIPDMGSTPTARRDVPPDSRLARALGTAVHRCLESLLYLPRLPDRVDPQLKKLLRYSLLDAGADHFSLKELQARGERSIQRVLEHDWARWMLSPERGERSPEIPMTLVDEGEVHNLVLDYVFVDEVAGERWVVDYKTATPDEGETPEHFMAAQGAKYGSQLAMYRKALEGRFPEPVRCALYFTALGKQFEVQT